MKQWVKYGLHVRLVEIQDARFILDLRTDPRLSRYMTGTSLSVRDQEEWIARYKERESRGETTLSVVSARRPPSEYAPANR